MKRIAQLAGLFLLAMPCYGQVQSAAADFGQTTSGVVTFKNPQTAGDSNAIFARVGGLTAIPKVTDPSGTVYNVIASQQQAHDGHTLYLLCGENIAGGSNTVTTALPAASTLRVDVIEFAGSCTKGALNTQQGTGIGPSAPIIPSPGDVVLSGISTGNAQAFTIPAPFVLSGIASKVAGAISSDGSGGPLWAITPDDWAEITVAFKQTAPAPTSALHAKLDFEDGSPCAACAVVVSRITQPTDTLIGTFTADAGGLVTLAFTVDPASSYRFLVVDAKGTTLADQTPPNLSTTVTSDMLAILLQSQVELMLIRKVVAVKYNLTKLP